MVYNLGISKESFKRFRISSFVLSSTFLTLFYIFEICIGVRTVIFVFESWNESRLSSSTADDVSWLMVVITILLSVITSCTVNAVSAFWNSNYSSGVRSAIFYAVHISTGGVIWRYISLLGSDTAEKKKEQATLIASLKFFFTQFFTIPLLIIHIFLINNLYELIYDLAMAICISISLILTCLIFENYEIPESYPHETMVLVPLLFRKFPIQDSEANKLPKEGTSETVEANGQEVIKHNMRNNVLWKCFTAMQVLFFTAGRLLALGILLKLAGIYGVTILFLQLLLSILYLKFQANYLIPETLSKFKQLMRLSFLSYILLFEWQLYRNPYTAYTLKQGTKHGMVYYSITTVESVFYLIVWMVTFKESFFHDQQVIFHNQHVVILSTIGCLSLLISYCMHISLIISRYDSSIFATKFHTNVVSRMRESWKTKRIFRRKNNSNTQPKEDNVCSSNDDSGGNKEIRKENQNEPEMRNSNLKEDEEYGSYRDLREYIGEDIAIKNQTVPRCESTANCITSPKNKSQSKQHQTQCKNETKLAEEMSKIEIMKKKLQPPKYLKNKLENLSSISPKLPKELNFPKISKRNESPVKNNNKNKQAIVKDKMNSMSNSITHQFNKITNLKNITGFPKKSENPVKTGTIPKKITIPTIMNAYGEELPNAETNPSNENYRPVVPPRKKERSEKVSEENKDEEMKNYTGSNNAFESCHDNLSTTLPEEKDVKNYGEDAEEFFQCDFYAEDDDVFEVDNYNLGDVEDKNSYPFCSQSSTSTDTSFEKQKFFAATPESFAKSFCLSCPDINTDFDEDVIYDSSLCSVGISSPTKRLKIRTISEGHDIDGEFLGLPLHNSPTLSEIEHYV